MTELLIGMGVAVAALLGISAWRRRGGRGGPVAGPAEQAGTRRDDGSQGTA